MAEKKELSAEHKANLKAGREKAQAERKAKIEAQGLIAKTPEVAAPVVTKTPTARRKTNFGPRLKLGVEGKIPGYKMQWTNDYDGDLEHALHNGWKFVGQDEIDVSNIQFRGTDKDVGNRVSRETSVGPGVRIRCYLLKIENEIYDEMMQEGEELSKALEKPIYEGTYGLGEHDYKSRLTNIR